MHPLPPRGPDSFRARAQEARTLAEQVSDPAAKRAFRTLAENYELLAKLAERKTLDCGGGGTDPK
jgi:hypothetical protein